VVEGIVLAIHLTLARTNVISAQAAEATGTEFWRALILTKTKEVSSNDNV
jgi:hypothetical protein